MTDDVTDTAISDGRLFQIPRNGGQMLADSEHVLPEWVFSVCILFEYPKRSFMLLFGLESKKVPE
jgi:hypothetical protein